MTDYWIAFIRQLAGVLLALGIGILIGRCLE
jgi:hypothetical protein